MEGKRVLVTGGAGFIGSNLALALAERNEVTVIDNLSTGRLENLGPLGKAVERADVRHLKAIPRDIDYVFHLAAFVSVPGSVLEPEVNDAVNVFGTQNVLSAAKEAGVEKVVFASSAAVYGEVPEDQLPVTEDMDLRPASPYAGAKMTAEDYCQLYNDMFGLRATSLRLFNVYGPRQDPGSDYAAVVPAFIGRLLDGKSPIIYGDGGQTRDLVFVDDVVAAFEAAAGSEASDGRAINVATGKGMSINELATAIVRAAGVDLEPVYEGPRPGDIRHSVASVDKAKKLLGWEAKVTLEEGIRLTYEWFASHRK